jgi:hypothetical protein
MLGDRQFEVLSTNDYNLKRREQLLAGDILTLVKTPLLSNRFSPIEQVEQSGFIVSETLQTRILFTTASPLKFVDVHTSTSANSPQHIFCNVDDLKLLTDIVMLVKSVSKSECLKSLSLLVPCRFKNRITRFLFVITIV